MFAALENMEVDHTSKHRLKLEMRGRKKGRGMGALGDQKTCRFGKIPAPKPTQDTKKQDKKKKKK